jgi:hypothetical protein
MEDLIQVAARALIAETRRPAKMILLDESTTEVDGRREDLAFLVVEADVEDTFAEAARLGTVLGRILIAAEVIVLGEKEFDRRAAVHGTVAFDAVSRGRLLAQT